MGYQIQCNLLILRARRMLRLHENWNASSDTHERDENIFKTNEKTNQTRIDSSVDVGFDLLSL